jgi:hypothetical protein
VVEERQDVVSAAPQGSAELGDLLQSGWHATADRLDQPGHRLLAALPTRVGVGGISIARGLLRDGHDVTVFERRPDVKAGGGAVTIWSNGATVLGQLGVDMDGAGQLLSTLRVVTSTGRPVATVDLTAIVDRVGAPVRMVPRRVLLEGCWKAFRPIASGSSSKNGLRSFSNSWLRLL